MDPSLPSGAKASKDPSSSFSHVVFLPPPRSSILSSKRKGFRKPAPAFQWKSITLSRSTPTPASSIEPGNPPSYIRTNRSPRKGKNQRAPTDGEGAIANQALVSKPGGKRSEKSSIVPETPLNPSGPKLTSRSTLSAYAFGSWSLSDHASQDESDDPAPESSSGALSARRLSKCAKLPLDKRERPVGRISSVAEIRRQAEAQASETRSSSTSSAGPPRIARRLVPETPARPTNPRVAPTRSWSPSLTSSSLSTTHQGSSPSTFGENVAGFISPLDRTPEERLSGRNTERIRDGSVFYVAETPDQESMPRHSNWNSSSRDRISQQVTPTQRESTHEGVHSPKDPFGLQSGRLPGQSGAEAAEVAGDGTERSTYGSQGGGKYCSSEAIRSSQVESVRPSAVAALQAVTDGEEEEQAGRIVLRKDHANNSDDEGGGREEDPDVSRVFVYEEEEEGKGRSRIERSEEHVHRRNTHGLFRNPDHGPNGMEDAGGCEGHEAVKLRIKASQSLGSTGHISEHDSWDRDAKLVRELGEISRREPSKPPIHGQARETAEEAVIPVGGRQVEKRKRTDDVGEEPPPQRAVQKKRPVQPVCRFSLFSKPSTKQSRQSDCVKRAFTVPLKALAGNEGQNHTTSTSSRIQSAVEVCGTRGNPTRVEELQAIQGSAPASDRSKEGRPSNRGNEAERVVQPWSIHYASATETSSRQSGRPLSPIFPRPDTTTRSNFMPILGGNLTKCPRPLTRALSDSMPVAPQPLRNRSEPPGCDNSRYHLSPAPFRTRCGDRPLLEASRGGVSPAELANVQHHDDGDGQYGDQRDTLGIENSSNSASITDPGLDSIPPPPTLRFTISIITPISRILNNPNEFLTTGVPNGKNQKWNTPPRPWGASSGKRVHLLAVVRQIGEVEEFRPKSASTSFFPGRRGVNGRGELGRRSSSTTGGDLISKCEMVVMDGRNDESHFLTLVLWGKCAREWIEVFEEVWQGREEEGKTKSKDPNPSSTSSGPEQDSGDSIVDETRSRKHGQGTLGGLEGTSFEERERDKIRIRIGDVVYFENLTVSSFKSSDQKVSVKNRTQAASSPEIRVTASDRTKSSYQICYRSHILDEKDSKINFDRDIAGFDRRSRAVLELSDKWVHSKACVD
ncbi:hypothetical protein IE53DRAFT_104746 [Violaceomyces palustris]|uniref:Uncharacterized protein n=1 Tax=Violaceomyces palustris TaxID=1673888 RepID=A0ACD0NWN6_9BASI|nr:hypothetical protein IE53DRAFT_104746 [Violaceomyces palustris]